MNRPMPPDSVLISPHETAFEPAPDVWGWAMQNIVHESGEIHNPDHSHLEHADVGVLWTNVMNSRKGRTVVGMAEQPKFMCNKWQKARQELQIMQWFDTLPDFIITLDAGYCAQSADVDFCMLLEHEMYHCAQQRDDFGAPKFSSQTGRPLFEIVGHDVEEFVGVVARYGVGNDSQLKALIDAASSRPQVAKAAMSRACGTCMARAA